MRQYLDAKAAASRRDPVLPHGRLLRDVLRRRPARRARARADADLASKDANGGGIPMCGVPFHAVDGYIARLVKKGFRVAICDQVEDPRKAKGLVKREVVRVVSPGTLTDAAISTRASRRFSWRSRPATRSTTSASRCSMSRPASSPRPNTRARTACRRSPTNSRCSGRARSSSPPSNGYDAAQSAAAWPMLAAAGVRGDHAPSRPGRSSPKRRAARCSISCAPAASKGSASTASPRPCRPPARWFTTCATTQKADLAHVRAISYRQRADALLDRSDHAQASRDRRGLGGRPRGLAARRARSHGDVDGQPAAARVAAAAAAGARADPRSPRRRRGARVSHDRARQVPRRDQGRPGSRAARRARRARHRRARAISSA